MNAPSAGPLGGYGRITGESPHEERNVGSLLYGAEGEAACAAEGRYQLPSNHFNTIAMRKQGICRGRLFNKTHLKRSAETSARDTQYR